MHIVSINFAKTLVWKHECDVTNSAHQKQMNTLCHWRNPPRKYENFSAYAAGESDFQNVEFLSGDILHRSDFAYSIVWDRVGATDAGA